MLWHVLLQRKRSTLIVNPLIHLPQAFPYLPPFRSRYLNLWTPTSLAASCAFARLWRSSCAKEAPQHTLIWLIRGTSLIHSFPQFEKPVDSCKIPHEQLQSAWFSMGTSCMFTHQGSPSSGDASNARRLSTMSRSCCNSNCAMSNWSKHEGTMEPRICMPWSAL